MGEMNSLSEIEKKRYKLQMLLQGIGAGGQEKLKSASVLVAGIGGLGSHVLQSLTAMGVGTLGFLDFDHIEEENLSHQIHYGMQDIGRLKAVVTKKRLSRLNPLVQCNMLNIEINSDNAGSIIPGYDIIIDATNKKMTHYLINDACIKYGKVMGYGCVCKMEGRVSVFNHRGGPSYRCAYPEDKNTGTDNPARENTGMPGILPGLTGLYLANEVLKVITGNPDVISGKVMIVDIFNYQNRFIEVTRNEANFKQTGKL
jgi:sulfur-carrier protein adenylyltransferase/sulfurtransferase